MARARPTRRDRDDRRYPRRSRQSMTVTTRGGAPDRSEVDLRQRDTGPDAPPPQEFIRLLAKIAMRLDLDLSREDQADDG
jgi:hypothetical protein